MLVVEKGFKSGKFTNQLPISKQFCRKGLVFIVVNATTDNWQISPNFICSISLPKSFGSNIFFCVICFNKNAILPYFFCLTKYQKIRSDLKIWWFAITPLGLKEMSWSKKLSDAHSWKRIAYIIFLVLTFLTPCPLCRFH